jgi:hypothetical protein
MRMLSVLSAALLLGVLTLIGMFGAPRSVAYLRRPPRPRPRSK